MLSAKRKLLLLSAFLCLMTLAWVGCQGFFVNPTLTSITITPSNPNVQVGGTLQLTATGNNDDGSTKNLTSSATWTSSDTTKVTVNSTGLIKGIANTGTTGVTITATSGAIEGTETVTVGQNTTITITCDSCTSGNTISLTTNGGTGTQVNFTAQQNGSDVNANWSSSNSSVISLSTTGSAQGVGTLGGSTGTVTITATTSGASGTLQVTVNP